MATGTIQVIGPKGKNGIFKVITVGPDDDCNELACGGKEITFVDPTGSSGVVVGGNAVGKIIDAGGSGIMIVINIQPQQ